MVLAVALMSSVSNGDIDPSEYTILIIDDGGYMDSTGGIVRPDPESRPKYNSSPLVWFLEGLGYNVDTIGMQQTFWSASKNGWSPSEDYGLYNYEGTDYDLGAHNWWEGEDFRLAHVEAADLVIATRFMASSNYGRDGDAIIWNGLDKPLIMQNGPLARGGGQTRKWGWEDSGGNSKPSATETDVTVDGFEELTLTMFDFSVFGGTTPHPLQVCNGEFPGEVLLEYMGYPFLVKIPAGTDLDAHSGTTDLYGTTGAVRVYFDIWGYDGNIWPGTDGYNWGECLANYPHYTEWFEGVVGSLVPEPATIALLGLGGLALLRKKR